jgi:CRISPR-associated protein Cmr4
MNEATATKKLYEHRRFVFMTLDPVHIGAGGYRLGRVDNTITREPGTNLPKIPGTSLAGAARSYAAMRYGKPAAAGQHKEWQKRKKEEKDKCPILYTFGTATDGSDSGAGGSRAGSVSLGDAHLLFFPVYSMAGPLWVSTKERVKEAWGRESIAKLPVEPDDKGQTTTSLVWQDDIADEKKRLNLGWLLLPTRDGLQITAPEEFSNRSEWQMISQRIVLASTKVFSQIVNSNLDVRTSVSINPETGAAEDGALFTYEAIPRAAWLWCDVVQDNYRELNSKPEDKEKNRFKTVDKQYNMETQQERAGDELGETWNNPMDVVRAGCRLIEHLGIGGMGTRGFGRMRLLGDFLAQNGGKQ